MVALKIIQIGDSRGGALSKEAFSHLSVNRGDTIYLTKTRDGSLQLSPYDEEVAREIVLGEKIMEEYRDTFRALAG